MIPRTQVLINPSARKLGHGTTILISTLNLAFNSFHSKVMHAKVHVENKASVRLFQNVGFIEIKRAE
jgi:RimJ/RimL family protein N-acetyltransferase